MTLDIDWGEWVAVGVGVGCIVLFCTPWNIFRFINWLTKWCFSVRVGCHWKNSKQLYVGATLTPRIRLHVGWMRMLTFGLGFWTVACSVLKQD